MFRMMRLMAIGAAMHLIGCQGFVPPHEIVAPTAGRVNVPITVAVTGAFTASDVLQWTATGGTFSGPTNAPSTKVVPSVPGPLSVVLTIVSSDGSTRTTQKTIQIAPLAGTPEAAAAALPAQARAAAPRTVVPRNVDTLGFIASGFMGDGADPQRRYLFLNPADRSQPHSPPSAYRVSYKPGPTAWAAIAWQYPENNWGDFPGKNLSSDGYTELSVWARSDPDPRTGGFPVVQFKAGGATDPTKKYQASFEAIGDFVTLTADWKEYVVPLGNNADLSNVAAAFIVVIKAQDVPATGATFYLDDITFR